MARTDLPDDFKQQLRQSVFDADGFIKLTQVSRGGGAVSRVSLRPVEIQGEALFQRETVAEGRTVVKNFDREAAQEVLEQILAQGGPREIHLLTKNGNWHLRMTKKGKLLESRSRPQAESDREIPAGHDRVKRQPLTEFDSSPLLRVLGIADAEGKIKASKRGKYDQINAFIKVIDDVVSGCDKKTLNIVDCGCAAPI